MCVTSKRTCLVAALSLLEVNAADGALKQHTDNCCLHVEKTHVYVSRIMYTSVLPYYSHVRYTVVRVHGVCDACV